LGLKLLNKKIGRGRAACFHPEKTKKSALAKIITALAELSANLRTLIGAKSTMHLVGFS